MHLLLWVSLPVQFSVCFQGQKAMETNGHFHLQSHLFWKSMFEFYVWIFPLSSRNPHRCEIVCLPVEWESCWYIQWDLPTNLGVHFIWFHGAKADCTASEFNVLVEGDTGSAHFHPVFNRHWTYTSIYLKDFHPAFPLLKQMPKEVHTSQLKQNKTGRTIWRRANYFIES